MYSDDEIAQRVSDLWRAQGRKPRRRQMQAALRDTGEMSAALECQPGSVGTDRLQKLLNAMTAPIAPVEVRPAQLPEDYRPALAGLEATLARAVNAREETLALVQRLQLEAAHVVALAGLERQLTQANDDIKTKNLDLVEYARDLDQLGRQVRELEAALTETQAQARADKAVISARLEASEAARRTLEDEVRSLREQLRAVEVEAAEVKGKLDALTHRSGTSSTSGSEPASGTEAPS